jgi:hypothetical protein
VGTIIALNDMQRRRILPYQDTNSKPSKIQPVATHYMECVVPELDFYNKQGKILHSFSMRGFIFSAT